MPALIVRSGPGAGKRYEIDGEAVVGRGDVDCVIDDAELSRRHVAVRVTAAGVEIEDLGSLNGTWFEGKRVTGPTVIPGGGVFRLGVSEVEVEISDPKPAARTVMAPVPPPPVEPVTRVAPVVAPPPVAAAPPEPATAVVPPPPTPAPAAPPSPDFDAQLTKIPIKARGTSKRPPTADPLTPPDEAPPPSDEAPPPAVDGPPPSGATTVPPGRSRRRPAPPPEEPVPSSSRRPSPRSRAGAGTGQLAPFSPPGKPGRRKVATRLVLPAVLTFLMIFATAIALIAYFALR